MKSPHKALLALLIATITLLAAGCTSRPSDETSIPWSRPAGWEGQVPGMGSTGGDTSGNR
jgi:nitrous oxide reductase accessory protein NosL